MEELQNSISPPFLKGFFSLVYFLIIGVFMFGQQNKIVNRMFRKVEGIVWDLSTNSLGLANTNGIYTLTQTSVPGATEDDAPTIEFGISVNPFDSFGFAIPAFAQLTKLEDITVGDIVIGDKGALGWVIQVRGKSLQLLDQNGMKKDHTPPKVAVLNQDGALVVKSLTGLFGQQGATGFSSALLPMLLAGGGDASGLDDLLPILLLTQQQAGDNSNSLASALPTILMMKAMGGNNGNGAGGLGNMLLPMILSGGLTGGAGAGGMNPMLLMALAGGGLGGDAGAQFVAGGLPVPQARPASGVVGVGSGLPPLTRTR